MLVSSNYTGLSGASLSDSVTLTQEENKIEYSVLNGTSYTVNWAFSTSSSKTMEYTSWSSAPDVDFIGIGTGTTKYTYNNYYTSGAGPEIAYENVQDFTAWYLSTATENYSELDHSLSLTNDNGSTKEYTITVSPVGNLAPINSTTFTFFSDIFKNSGGSSLNTIQYSVTTQSSTPSGVNTFTYSPIYMGDVSVSDFTINFNNGITGSVANYNGFVGNTSRTIGMANKIYRHTYTYTDGVLTNTTATYYNMNNCEFSTTYSFSNTLPYLYDETIGVTASEDGANFMSIELTYTIGSISVPVPRINQNIGSFDITISVYSSTSSHSSWNYLDDFTISDINVYMAP